ncbi:transglycosylase SLT domain-containing protein [Bacillus sp. JCM 19041]|uniref:transglycosylase SLT domain-containing protein n=1 Tax=Bacillus sp. JCM 19041 TaxID=1460637 RepID=UPI000B2CD77F
MTHYKKLLLAIGMVIPAIIVFIFIQNYREMQEELALQEEQMEQLFGSMKDQLLHSPMATDSLEFEEEHAVWSDSMVLAETLYEDSEGHFKQEWGMYLGHLTAQRDMDPFLVYELLKLESGPSFDTNAVGPQTKYGRAYGMAQFMTNTAPWIADMAGVEYRQELLFDPFYAIQLSVEYLDFLYDYYEDWDKTLTAYNRGIGGLETFMEQNGHAKSDYAVTITEQAEEHTAQEFVYNKE